MRPSPSLDYQDASLSAAKRRAAVAMIDYRCCLHGIKDRSPLDHQMSRRIALFGSNLLFRSKSKKWSVTLGTGSFCEPRSFNNVLNRCNRLCLHRDTSCVTQLGTKSCIYFNDFLTVWSESPITKPLCDTKLIRFFARQRSTSPSWKGQAAGGDRYGFGKDHTRDFSLVNTLPSA